MQSQCAKGNAAVVDAMLEAVDAGREKRRLQSAIRPSDKSTVGTQIRTAIEMAADFKMQCGHLLSYLRTLNKSDTHNATEIVTRLLTELELPSVCRTKIGSLANQRTWLESIVSEVLQ